MKKQLTIFAVASLCFNALSATYICMSRQQQLELNLEKNNTTLICRDRFSREYDCDDYLRSTQVDGNLTQLQFKNFQEKDLLLTFKTIDFMNQSPVLFGFMNKDSIQCQQKVI